MREIKFRGKMQNGAWVYGSFWDHPVYPDIIDEYSNHHLVDRETVGQFTGLLDCEGQEIYEGDVIKVVTKNPYWAFKKNYAVYWDLDGFCLEGEPLYYWFKLHDLKVIGNIHDSPELLEDSNGRI